MIKFEHTEIVGWEPAIRGMRNAYNSWEKSDSKFNNCDNTDCSECKCDIDHGCGYMKYVYNVVPILGPEDMRLMKKLRNAGTDHRKYLRMIVVYVDITAPLYWWKEFDTYKVGTVANSCSTMHTIADKEFTLDDFSCERLMDNGVHCYPLGGGWRGLNPTDMLKATIELLNNTRRMYLETKDKKYWWQMIQLLPSSYNQKRTIMLNYEVLANIYKSRKTHKLDEWKAHTYTTTNAKEWGNKVYLGFCDWIETLPYSELITGEELLWRLT